MIFSRVSEVLPRHDVIEEEIERGFSSPFGLDRSITTVSYDRGDTYVHQGKSWAVGVGVGVSLPVSWIN